jgi:hypothetical protein
LIGEGKNRDPIEANLTAEEKKNLIFLGRRADVESLIQIMDVGVFVH